MQHVEEFELIAMILNFFLKWGGTWKVLTSGKLFIYLLSAFILLKIRKIL